MTAATGLTEAATFIPEIWSDEIVAAYKANLVLANLVKKMPMQGKKGDKIHVPAPTRGSANAKAENTAVTLIGNTESEVAIDINQHYEYSRLIEDIVSKQALTSLRQFYTGDAGYALAKQVDTHLFACATAFDGGALVLAPATDGTDHDSATGDGGVFFNDATNGATKFAIDTVVDADVFDDAFFRNMIQKLDDADVPMDNRFLIVPPSQKNTLLGIDRYVSADFTGQRGVQNGKIGELYGIDIYCSTNCPVIETAAAGAAGLTVDCRGALLAHRDTLVLAEQMGVRSQAQYKQEYLADLLTSDTLYGVQVLRDDAGFMLALPDLAA